MSHFSGRLGGTLGFVCCLLAPLLATGEEPSVLDELKKLAADEADAAAEASQTFSASTLPATHAQIGTIALAADGGQCIVNTFCMDGAGRLLVAVGGVQKQVQAVDGERQVSTETEGNEIRVYSHEGKLLETWKVPFTPQSLNVAPDQSVYVAGGGQIARLDSQGQIVKQGSTPQITDMEAFKQEIRNQLAEQAKARVQQFAQQIEQAELIIEKLMAKPASERTAIDKLRLKNAQRQLDVMKNNTQAAESSGADIDIDYYLTYKLKVPGLAVTDKDVFVAVSATKGYGYDVWRMDHEFQNPVQIVTGMRGCCGQMDIQAQDGDVYVAENSMHRVVRYNRDGEMICQWGKNDRTGKEGFEGCCNPMNLRFGANGEVLTAESGNGAIKRFDKEGNFLGLLGNATLQGGCKHVAIAATADAGRVFMLDVPRSQIAILAPKTAEDSAETPAATGATSVETPAATEAAPAKPAVKLKLTPKVLQLRSAKDAPQ